MERLFQQIEEHASLYKHWLLNMCNQPSISAKNIGMLEMKELVMQLLEDLGAEVEEVLTTGYPIIYAHIDNGKKRTLTFYNHYDVQPPDPLTEWVSDPFEAKIEDGQIFARGVADNKGNIAARIAAVHAYQKVHGELPVNVKFIIEGEEEVGSPNLKSFASENPEKLKTDAMIWEGGMRNVHDKRPHISFGVKGICFVEMQVKGAAFDLHSSEAAVVENPAWRLVWALSTLKNSEEMVQIEGFYDDVIALTEKEKAFFETMDYDEEHTKGHYQIDNFLTNVTGIELKERLTAAPTCTICGLEAGHTGEGAKTVLPSSAKVKLDFRLVPGQTPKKVMKLLRNHLDLHGFQDIEIEQLAGLLPFNSDANHPFVDTVIKSMKEVYEEPPIIMRNLAGSSPMEKLLADTRIPAAQIGVANTESNFHGPNENIYIEDFMKGIKATANVIRHFGVV
ncbi:M20/M25/M40 family metallo-hydrolase [Oceanobacillus manasiensis]|uniref:M20/M25/M40 family metallo-hydrolase n=1 Tax=Oceanobacillus manasiensis TaxID=586413 RepID=UPI0005A7AE93|nr:M20/M25/M40 family metallo-hydrolase [Oceanobacillus manasiensis]